jgi:hypothetical protein
MKEFVVVVTYAAGGAVGAVTVPARQGDHALQRVREWVDATYGAGNTLQLTLFHQLKRLGQPKKQGD